MKYIKVNNNIINLNKKFLNTIYNLPCRFISYQNSSLVKIIVDIK